MSDANYSDTAAMDEKKAEQNQSTTNPVNTFFAILFIQLIYLILFIFVGGYMLYCSKISLTGIMPDNTYVMPYRSENRIPVELNEPIININYIKGKDETITNKIYFPYDVNNEVIDNSFIIGIGAIRSWIEDIKTANVYTYYFANIWQKMLSFYIKLLFGFYGFLQANCTETMIIFLGPFIIIWILLFINIIVGLYGVILYFLELPKLFSEKICVEILPSDISSIPNTLIKRENDGGELITNQKGGATESISAIDVKPSKYIVDWNDSPEKNGFGIGISSSWFWTPLVVIIACISTLFGSLLLVTYFLIRTNLSALFLPLYMTAQEIDEESYNTNFMNDPSNTPRNYDKDVAYTYYTLLEHILKYKKRIIMFIISYFVLSDSYSALGSYGLIVGIVACIIIYIFFPEIYKNYTKSEIEVDNLSLASDIISNKYIVDPLENGKSTNPCAKPKGFFSRIFGYGFALLNFFKKQSDQDKKGGSESVKTDPSNSSSTSGIPTVIKPNGDIINPGSVSPPLSINDTTPTIIRHNGEKPDSVSPPSKDTTPTINRLGGSRKIRKHNK